MSGYWPTKVKVKVEISVPKEKPRFRIHRDIFPPPFVVLYWGFSEKIFYLSIMWIQVRSFDGKTSLQVDDLSKLTKIEDLRLRLVEKFEAPPERQRLFYRGKQVTPS